MPAVRARVAAAVAGGPPLVLAVSGGRDSVGLLDAVLHAARERVLAVATFDHGTGPGASAAVAHVRALGRAAGVPVVAGRAPTSTASTEAGWRAARWRFLRRVARETARRAGVPAAVIATGHTEDDQVETVVMRVLRGAGPRGLAGLYAPAPGIVRPLLTTSAAEVAAYAAACGLTWVEDATNAGGAHLRNRVRHDVLPAVGRARPAFRAALLALAHDAAAWRAEVERAADALVVAPPAPEGGRDGVAVPLARLAGYDGDALAVLWPAIAARAGVRLDRRGTARLVAFTTRSVGRGAAGGVPDGRVPVAGHAEVALQRLGASPERAMVVRRAATQASAAPQGTTPVPLGDGAHGACYVAGGVGWRFTSAAADDAGDAWRMRLDPARRYVVRGWRPGDRMRVRPGGAARRVKRFLADRHVPAAQRAGWPVVVAVDPALAAGSTDAAEGEIVWIPGVRRSDAAPARPGLPGLVLHCDRTRRSLRLNA